jgi:hypothetical protein
MAAKAKKAPENVSILKGSSEPTGAAPKFEPAAMGSPGHHPVLMSHPDAELIELGMFYLARRSTMEAAFDREYELNEVYEATKPPPPEAIRFSPKDELLRGPEEWVHHHNEEYYNSNDIEFLRNKERTMIVLIEGRERVIFRDERLVDHEAQRRAEIVIAAFDTWDAECKRIEEETGAAEAERVATALGEEVDEIAKKIWAIPARTLNGLAIKASVVRDLNYEASECEPIITVLGEQIAAIAGAPIASPSSNAADAQKAAA